MKTHKLARYLLIAIAFLGMAGVSPYTYNQFLGQFECPKAGPLPICYLVFTSYLLVLISGIRDATYSVFLFWIGWTVVFGMAVTGTTLEIAGQEACPLLGGVPACYYSFVASVSLLFLHLMTRKYRPGL